MKPFRTSLTARVLSVGASVALFGGGLAAVSGAPWLIPYILVFTLTSGIVGLINGVEDHAASVILMAVLLPLMLWPYVMTLEIIATRAPVYGWLLMILGAGPVALTGIAPWTVLERRESMALNPHSAH